MSKPSFEAAVAEARTAALASGLSEPRASRLAELLAWISVRAGSPMGELVDPAQVRRGPASFVLQVLDAVSGKKTRRLLGGAAGRGKTASWGACAYPVDAELAPTESSARVRRLLAQVRARPRSLRLNDTLNEMTWVTALAWHELGTQAPEQPVVFGVKRARAEPWVIAALQEEKHHRHPADAYPPWALWGVDLTMRTEHGFLRTGLLNPSAVADPEAVAVRVSLEDVDLMASWFRSLGQQEKIMRRTAEKETTAKAKKATAKKATPKKRPKVAKAPKSTPGKTGPDVAALRRALGAVLGKKALSRGKLAKLLGASPGSIYNWERGTEISKAFVSKVEDFAAKAKAGQVTREMLGGGKAGRPARAVATKRTARSRSAKVSLVGEVPVVYANVVNVTRGEHEARLTFGLVLPGESSGRVLCDVVVPVALIQGIGG